MTKVALPILAGMFLASPAFAQNPNEIAQNVLTDKAALDAAVRHMWDSVSAYDREQQAEKKQLADQLQWWSDCWNGKLPGCLAGSTVAASSYATKPKPGPQMTPIPPEND